MPDIPDPSVPTSGGTDETMPAPTFSLNPDQAVAAGLANMQPGDTFTVTIHGTITDNTNGISANIDNAIDGAQVSPVEAQPEEGEAEGGVPPAMQPKPKQQVMGPKDLGLTDLIATK